MAFALSSTSHEELSRGTYVLPSWSFIETELPTKGVVRIVRAREREGSAANAGSPGASSNPTAVSSTSPIRRGLTPGILITTSETPW
jgi:hypothetical protein